MRLFSSARNITPYDPQTACICNSALFRTTGNDVRFVGRAEAEVVKGEQRVSSMRRQISQQLQGPGHLKDTLLAIFCRWQTGQQSEPEGQGARTTACWCGLRTRRFGHRHWEEWLKEIILKKTINHMKTQVFSIKWTHRELVRNNNKHLLQDASAVTWHGQVNQEREGQVLDRAVVWGERGQLHDRVHQRAIRGAFRTWNPTGAAAAHRTACWEQKTNTFDCNNPLKANMDNDAVVIDSNMCNYTTQNVIIHFLLMHPSMHCTTSLLYILFFRKWDY